jgi:hypothetical protein
MIENGIPIETAPPRSMAISTPRDTVCDVCGRYTEPGVTLCTWCAAQAAAAVAEI